MQQSNLERAFAKADAEHTANAERLQQSANRREMLRRQLMEARDNKPEAETENEVEQDE